MEPEQQNRSQTPALPFRAEPTSTRVVESGAAAILPGTLLEDSKNKASLTAQGDVEKPGMSMKNLIIALQRASERAVANQKYTSHRRVEGVENKPFGSCAPVYTRAEESLKHL